MRSACATRITPTRPACPIPTQITTAHDLAVLGRAIQDRFPRYYRYFSTQSFAYHGALHRNHNHLLGHVEGMDGIKTGYTRASGFNLLTSVRRDGHHIVAVVLGGATAAARDRIMAGLIERAHRWRLDGPHRARHHRRRRGERELANRSRRALPNARVSSSAAPKTRRTRRTGG